MGGWAHQAHPRLWWGVWWLSRASEDVTRGRHSGMYAAQLRWEKYGERTVGAMLMEMQALECKSWVKLWGSSSQSPLFYRWGKLRHCAGTWLPLGYMARWRKSQGWKPCLQSHSPVLCFSSSLLSSKTKYRAQEDFFHIESAIKMLHL